MMWAAILSDKEVSLEEVSKELANRGWTVASSSIEEMEAIPADVMVWILFNCTGLREDSFTCQGFVRIATINPVEETSFYVISDSWLIRTYYQVIMELNMWYLNLKHRLFPDR